MLDEQLPQIRQATGMIGTDPGTQPEIQMNP
jgi:hypothetical protein